MSTISPYLNKKLKLVKLLRTELLFAAGLVVVLTPIIAKNVYDMVIYKDLTYSLFTLSVCFFVLIIFSRKNKYLWFNLAFLFLAVGVTEKYLIYKKNNMSSLLKLDIPPGFAEYNDLLGYAPKRNQRQRFAGHYGDTLLFDVNISIDENRLRKTPKYTPTPETKSIVFMGCSFPFGYGLNDQDVMPNIVQNIVKSKYKVYNLGYEGYGTHQVLATAESNRLDTLLKFEPRLFVYPVIEDHLNRIKGYHFWNYYSNEPKYVLDNQSKEVVRQGRMHDEGVLYKKVIDSELAGLFQRKQADSTDVDLFVAMVLKTKRLLKKKFPASEFQIVFWNANTPGCKVMLRKLRENNINPVLITDIMPDYYTSIQNYCIYFPHELHPNRLANKQIAEYLVKNVIKFDTNN